MSPDSDKTASDKLGAIHNFFCFAEIIDAGNDQYSNPLACHAHWPRVSITFTLDRSNNVGISLKR